ncbi:MAG TPA: LEPR-XLL domain-containing protein [Phycisphaerae bacterium]|nr:LEPR-XLL domain-containing protein [Phycisphaerae bacterium]
MHTAPPGSFRSYLHWLGSFIFHHLPSQSRQTICPAAVRAVLEPLEPRLLLSALPTGFLDLNIGSPSLSGLESYTKSNNEWPVTGMASYTNNKWSVTGVGTGIAGTSDQFNYACENWAGGGTLTAKVGEVGKTSSGAQAGLMIRDSNAAGAEFAAVLVNSKNQVSFEYRSSTGGTVTTVTMGKSKGSPWIQLVETQNQGSEQFTAYYSTDDKDWTAINTTPVTINFQNSTNLAGLAVTSGTAKKTDTVNFSDFSALPVGAGNTTSVVTNNNTYSGTTIVGGGGTIVGGGAIVTGTISGTGSLTILGSAPLTLTGSSTYSGTTTISGTLTLSGTISGDGSY